MEELRATKEALIKAQLQIIWMGFVINYPDHAKTNGTVK